MDSNLTQRFKRIYERWILHNTDSVRHIETLLKSMLFFLPGRFKDQELTSELVTGAVSVFGVVNDAVWLRKAKEYGKATTAVTHNFNTYNTPRPSIVEELPSDDESSPEIEQAVGSEVPISTTDSKAPSWSQTLQPEIKRQLLSIYQRSPSTLLHNTKLHFILSILNESELVLELMAHEASSRLLNLSSVVNNPHLTVWISRIRGTTILLVELVKAFIRLVLLWRNGGHMLTRMAVPAREDSIALAHSEEDSEENNNNDGIPIPQLPSLQNKNVYTRFTWDHIAESTTKITPTSPSFGTILGEFLWIIRPLLFVWMKIKHGKTWNPWFISFLVDVASHMLSKKVLKNGNEAETNEVSRRKWLLLLYLLRSPCYETITQLTNGATSKIYTSLSRVPAAQTAWDWLAELLDVHRNRYFYLAGSGSP